MSKVGKALYLQIAEPRIYRVLQFIIYLGLFAAGTSVLISNPPILVRIVGVVLLDVFAIFIVMGGLLGAVAVLPGIWWLERVAILLICPALAMYVVMIITVPASPASVIFSIALTLMFMQRWLLIKDHQLSPKKV